MRITISNLPLQWIKQNLLIPASADTISAYPSLGCEYLGFQLVNLSRFVAVKEEVYIS